MADGISIPGVSNKYNTNEMVDALIAVERKPLEREKETLEKYQSQQTAWRDVNQKMTSLRDSVKTLYSFENPFNNKLASSSEENSITADAGREAEYGNFKIDVINPATTDRFLSDNIDKNTKVPAGNYSFQVGNKNIKMNWKGGKLSEWVSAINKRGGETLKTSLIGVSKDKQSLLIESLIPGEENKIVFKDTALDFAKNIGMIQNVKSESINLGNKSSSWKTPSTNDLKVQQGMPPISKNDVKEKDGIITIPPRNGISIEIPEIVNKNSNNIIEFEIKSTQTNDITNELNNKTKGPSLPYPGEIDFKGVVVTNNQSDTTLPTIDLEKTIPLEPIKDQNILYIVNSKGIETPVDISKFPKNNETGMLKVSIPLSEYPEAQNIVIRNENTGDEIKLSIPQAFDSAKDLGYAPSHPISTAKDALFKYEGITLSRSSNNIDDVIPNVTLHLHDKTEKTATIKIEPDKESAKDALITFVGKYNQTIAEMNILSINKPEIISELDYLSKDEQETETKKLGMFQGDITLSNGKNSLQQIISTNYRYSEDDIITLLSQIGISTNASSNTGYSASRLRGYLEVDEKKLDSALETNLEQIKRLFGFDSDGDLIIDNGIGVKLDKQLTAWVQSGGILSIKTSTLDRNIKNSNDKIAKLETQLNNKEAELRYKYNAMQGTLNNLESQSTTITNFSNQNNNNR